MNPEFVAFKVESCVRLAKVCSRDSWQQPAKYRRENQRIKREAMQDAREWLTDGPGNCAEAV